MAINRAQLAKELEPGLNALFGMEYSRYENEHAEIFDQESSDRAFEEEVMLVGFGEAAVKQEGSAVQFDTAQESFTARYSHETVALAFSLTEEAVEDNLIRHFICSLHKIIGTFNGVHKANKSSEHIKQCVLNCWW